MIIRKATEKDLQAVADIYADIHTAEESGLTTIGWIRDVYPTAKTAELSLQRGDLFVAEDEGVIVGTAIINQQQVDVYENADWNYTASDEEVMVLHTLVISPKCLRKGYGRRFVEFYEQYARMHHCPYLRMDTNEKNSQARAMYKKLGYQEIGIVSCVFNGIEGVRLVLLEKTSGKINKEARGKAEGNENEKEDGKNDKKKNEKKKNEKVKETVTVDSAVQFGRWKQGKDGRILPLEWEVLAEYEDKILLHSTYGLRSMPYTEKGGKVYWESSEIRQWLTNEFMEAFNEEEKACICETEVENIRGLKKDEPEHFFTREKVFLLSENEIKELNQGKEFWVRKPSPWAKAEGAYTDKKGNGVWWLRSYGRLEKLSMCVVRADGGLYPGGDVRADDVMVCPAIFIKR